MSSTRPNIENKLTEKSYRGQVKAPAKITIRFSPEQMAEYEVKKAKWLAAQGEP